MTHKLFTEKFLVDLVVESCTSNFRGLVGIPCQHVCYGHSISPINGHKMWPTTEYTEILDQKPDEDPTRIKLRRVTTPYDCRRCGQRGHNIRKCTMPPTLQHRMPP